MPITARYVHTNIVAHDWERLADFYERVFGCKPLFPERDLSGQWLDEATGLLGAHIRGIHLQLPGYGSDGPTLEIFQYDHEVDRISPAINRPGLAHIAFSVDDVDTARHAVLDAGGADVGHIATLEVIGKGWVTIVYVRDPEGNIIELQRWSEVCSSDNRSSTDLEMSMDLEEQLRRCLTAGDRQSAVKLLLEHVIRACKDKDFSRAESLRERIFEVDSMALNEIIQAAEVIEDSRRTGMDRDHLAIWSKLYGNLTTEEANALYYAMMRQDYESDQSVFAQGERNTQLFFVNQGQLKHIYRQGEREGLIKTLGPGEIAGEETFFSNTFCTSSLIALSKANLSVLPRVAFDIWKERLPTLYSKLIDFCLQQEKTSELIKKKELNRRLQQRFTVAAKVTIQLMTASGAPIGHAFAGELANVSAGGLCFVIHISKTDTARMLLGRRLRVIVELPTVDGTVDRTGLIIAVQPLYLQDYSIHVRFDGALSDRTMADIAQIAKI